MSFPFPALTLTAHSTHSKRKSNIVTCSCTTLVLFSLFLCFLSPLRRRRDHKNSLWRSGRWLALSREARVSRDWLHPTNGSCFSLQIKKQAVIATSPDPDLTPGISLSASSPLAKNGRFSLSVSQTENEESERRDTCGHHSAGETHANTEHIKHALLPRWCLPLKIFLFCPKIASKQ